MLAADQLAELYRSHRNEKLLSVYLDTDQSDFAERAKWRLALKNQAAAQREVADDIDGFDRALAHLEEVLSPDDARFLSGRGWVGFATPDRCVYAEALPVPMPNLVRWETGLRVAPYTRALKQSRPVIAALIDSRRARLMHYQEGALTESGRLHADTYLGDLTDVNVAKRATSYSGTRGKTGTDAAQRFLDVERDRLVGRVADEIRAAAGGRGLVVVGGAMRTVDALFNELSDLGADRRRKVAGLSFDLTDAEIRAKVEAVASEISAADGQRVLERLLEGRGPNGDACLGDEDTERALREMRVATLVVTEELRRSRPDRVDHLEGAAWEQGAEVVELSRDAGARLDEEARGVGALLRYRVSSN
jgi:hypothetical protein